jgi:hypothetical protein
MTVKRESPATAGLRAGFPRRKSFGDDDRLLAQNHAAAQAGSRARRQRLVEQLHRLGPAPLFHALAEIERGASVAATLETYAELDPDFIRAYHGDQFTPSTFLIREDGAT